MGFQLIMFYWSTFKFFYLKFVQTGIVIYDPRHDVETAFDLTANNVEIMSKI